MLVLLLSQFRHFLGLFAYEKEYVCDFEQLCPEKEKRSINQNGRAEIIGVLFSAIIFEYIIIQAGFPGCNTLFLFVLLIFNQIYT